MNINLTSPVNTLSYGYVGLNLIKTLAKSHNVALFPIGNVEADQQEHALLKQCLKNAEFFDKNTPSLRIFHQFSLAQHVGKGLHAGFPIFELNAFNDVEKHHLLSQDLLFVPSGWARKVLIDNGIDAEKVCVAAFGVDAATFVAKSEVHKALLPNNDNTTVFLTVGKWEVRKNHQGIVQAFNQAFGENDNVILVMACSNPFCSKQETEDWTKLCKNSRLGSKIEVIGRRLNNQAEVAALMRAADCGVFPSLAEGWDMGLAEMMAMGKTVIATNYSAHTEFCNQDNAKLIEIDRTEPAFDGKWFFGQGEWAHFGPPQMDQLVTHLRSVHEARQGGQLKVNESGIDLFKNRLTWSNTAEKIVDGLLHSGNGQ